MRTRGLSTCTVALALGRATGRLYTWPVSEWRSVGAVEGRADLGAVTADGLELALARLDDGSWAAFDNACTHEECPLSDGDLEGDRIICYCHSSVFDVRTGAVLEGPAEDPLAVYEVRISEGELEVRVGS